MNIKQPVFFHNILLLYLLIVVQHENSLSSFGGNSFANHGAYSRFLCQLPSE